VKECKPLPLTGCVKAYAALHWALVRQLPPVMMTKHQGLTLVHFSAQVEPFLTQNTP
jgi:hypothetical protein